MDEHQQGPERIGELEARVRELSAAMARLAHPAGTARTSPRRRAPAATGHGHAAVVDG